MNTNGWLQLALYVVALVMITKPTGLYLLRVLDANGKTWLDPVFRPLERLTYRLLGVGADKEHDWKQYTLAMLLFSLVSCVFTYAILRLQHLLPFNPQGLGPLSPDLAFNTAVSFTTNTNWQSYVGESTMSYLSQTATWKERKSVSVFSTPRCSPRSQLTPRAARSIRCTIRSPRWAGSSRCSTFNSAKSSSAASARDSMECSCSSCSRYSSRG